MANPWVPSARYNVKLPIVVGEAGLRPEKVPENTPLDVGVKFPVIAMPVLLLLESPTPARLSVPLFALAVTVPITAGPSAANGIPLVFNSYLPLNELAVKGVVCC